MARPDHLPNYTSPPLDEVIIGVQFPPSPAYSSVHAKDIWDLFKDQYPKVQEHAPIDPSFETFGGTVPQFGMPIRFGPAAVRGRLWFVSEDETHLVQVQDDRFLINWRRRPACQSYPRFESIAEAFEEHFIRLQEYFKLAIGRTLDVNQVEITYINFVPVDDYSQIGNWFQIGAVSEQDIESIALNFAEVIKNSEDQPIARMFHDLQSVVSMDGMVKAIKLVLSVKGKPTSTDIAAAMEFVRIGRDKIVNRFTDLATEEAHKLWGRVQ